MEWIEWNELNVISGLFVQRREIETEERENHLKRWRFLNL